MAHAGEGQVSWRRAVAQQLTKGQQSIGDYIAVSFPRNAADMNEAKALIAQENPDEPPGVIAKIERTEAIHEIDNIIKASDGVMVARGDLAVEIGDAEVPLVQKEIIQLCSSFPIYGQ